MEKIIRDSNDEDLELLEEMYINEFENHEERAQQFAKDLIRRFKTIICISDKQILGTISWDTRDGLNDGVVEVVGLGVNSNYRKQGIGRALVLSLIREAKKFFSKFGYKLRVIYLFMERNNETGRKFYNFMGFREVSVVPAFYPHDDAVFWIKYF